jgi:2-keto-4-pentenoate hydratase/2-oxohepta-3-ene-1,7-dioic acid hydratase in catechol pathway
VAEILAAVGANFSFEPGDVVLTGTPPGVGSGRKPPRYLRDGETMTATIDGIGSLTTPVRDRTPAHA